MAVKIRLIENQASCNVEELSPFPSHNKLLYAAVEITFHFFLTIAPLRAGAVGQRPKSLKSLTAGICLMPMSDMHLTNLHRTWRLTFSWVVDLASPIESPHWLFTIWGLLFVKVLVLSRRLGTFQQSEWTVKFSRFVGYSPFSEESSDILWCTTLSHHLFGTMILQAQNFPFFLSLL